MITAYSVLVLSAIIAHGNISSDQKGRSDSIPIEETRDETDLRILKRIVIGTIGGLLFPIPGVVFGSVLTPPAYIVSTLVAEGEGRTKNTDESINRMVMSIYSIYPASTAIMTLLSPLGALTSLVLYEGKGINGYSFVKIAAISTLASVPSIIIGTYPMIVRTFKARDYIDRETQEFFVFNSGIINLSGIFVSMLVLQLLYNQEMQISEQ